jgi:hypothetical protein
LEYLKDTVDPDEFKLNDWGNWASEDDALGFIFSLQDESIIKVKVDIGSGVIREAVYGEQYRDYPNDILIGSTTTYKYNEEGILSEEDYHGLALKDGQMWWENESEVKYDASGNITEGYELDSYYAGGMLTQMDGVIGVSKNGSFKLYAVGYDIDSVGSITYTHVYDQDGNEVLGCDGLINPLDIINQFQAGTEEIRNTEENIVEAENNNFSEIMDRMAIQDEAAQQAADHRFVSEMAKKAEEIQQPQAQNQ